jgi:Ca-activated chloride channel family protein
MQSLRTLSFGEAKHKVVILLTDGYHNAGKHAPKRAVEAARKAGVRIYTIGIGSKSDYDAALLETIAKETGAESFSAADAQSLQEVFTQITALEPSPIRSENYLHQRLLIFLPLLAALALLVLWVLRETKEHT